jgi:hypothetical protein
VERWRRKKVTNVIAGIELAWEIVEYTRPWQRPENGKIVRSKRDVDSREDDDGHSTDYLGDPVEQDDDELPTGAVLWTKEREQLLHDILGMLGDLDRRMVELFRGDAEALADKLDGMRVDPSRLRVDPSRLLAAPPDAEVKPTKKRKARTP